MNHRVLFSQCRCAGLLFIASAALLMASSAGSFTWKRYAATDYIWQVACDSDNCWVVTNAGVTRFSLSNALVAHYTSDNSSLSSSYRPQIALDNNLDTWVLSQKLFRFNNGQLEDMSGVISTSLSNPLWNIFVDPQGTLWAMNSDTMFHLNGSSIEAWHFQWPSNSGQFAVDTLGCLYICSGREGLSKNDHGQTTMFTITNSGLPADQYGTPFFLTAIAVDANNMKWIGTDGGGLVMYDGAWHLFDTTNSSIPFNYIESIHAGPNNRLWIMGQSRLACFDGHQWEERSDILSTLPKTTLMLRAADRGGRLYFATTEGRLYLWEGTSKEIPIATVPLAGNRLPSLAMDRHDVLWMVSDNPYTGNTRCCNICSFDGRNWASYDSSACFLLNNAMGIIAIDRNDTKWFANTGLCTYDGTTWRGYDSSAMGFALSFVTSIVFDSRNRPWIGTSHGLATFDGSRWQLFDTANSALPYPSVASVVVDKNDTRWLIAHSASAGWCELSCPPSYWAVCTMDSAGFHVQDLSSFPIRGASNLSCDSSGRILVLADSGIVRLDKGQWDLIKCDVSQRTGSMVVDPHGSLWLTAYSGVFRLGPDGWTKIALPDSQFSGSYRQVAFNSNGNLFYSGNDLGLFVGTTDQNLEAKEKPLLNAKRHVSQSGIINPFGPTRFRGLAAPSSTVALFDLRGRLISTCPIIGNFIGNKAIRKEIGASHGMYLYKTNAK